MFQLRALVASGKFQVVLAVVLLLLCNLCEEKIIKKDSSVGIYIWFWVFREEVVS